MKDKVVLVTGGGTGIGLAIANRFIDLGAFVVITGRRESKLSDAVEKLGSRASYFVGDVTQSGAPRRRGFNSEVHTGYAACAAM